MKKTIFLIGTAAIAASLLACSDDGGDGPKDIDGSGGSGDGDGSGGGANENYPDSDFVLGGLGTGTLGDVTWSGYTFAVASEVSTSTITPTMFSGSNLCVKGLMAAGYEEWALVGWNIAQELDPVSNEGGDVLAIAPGSTGVNVQVRNNGASGLRVQIQTDDLGTESWCLNIMGDGGDYAWSEFRKECWVTTGEAYDGTTPIAQIAVQTFNGSDTMPSEFDYCVLHIGPY